MDASTIPTPRERIDVLQMLRGLAALYVVTFHARTYITSPQNADWAHWLFYPGASGVDLFFCLSGFVMAYTTRSAQSRSPLDFSIKRVSRILPAYAVLTIIFSIVMGSVFDLTGFHDHNYRLKPVNILTSLLFVPPNLTSPSEAPMWGGATLGVGWTLNYEMYFYAIFALSLCFGRARWVAFFAWFALTLLVLPFARCGSVTLDPYAACHWKVGYLNLMTSPLVWEFVAGVLVCFLYLSPVRFPSRQVAWTSVAVAATLAAWIVLTEAHSGFGLPRWGYVYLILFAATVIADKTVGFRIPFFFIWLGGLSYSLYLVHPIVVQSLGILFFMSDTLHPLMTGVPFVLFFTALSVLAAIPAHRYLEVGLSTAVRRWAEHAVGRIQLSRPGQRTPGMAQEIGAPVTSASRP